MFRNARLLESVFVRCVLQVHLKTFTRSIAVDILKAQDWQVAEHPQECKHIGEELHFSKTEASHGR
jgi:hypothetical protein